MKPSKIKKIETLLSKEQARELKREKRQKARKEREELKNGLL